MCAFSPAFCTLPDTRTHTPSTALHAGTLASNHGVCILSKTDLIMSRYRPIAPKPTSFPSSPPLHVADPIDGVISVSPGFRHVPQSEGIGAPSKRTRKRKGGSAAGPERARKKGCAVAAAPSTAAASCLSSQFNAEMVCVDGHSVQKQTTPALSCLTEATRLIHEDAEFMARAAASAPPSLLPDPIKMGSRSGFTEMIRGITGLSTAASVHNLMHQSSRALLNLTLARPLLGLVISPGAHVNTESMELELGLSPASPSVSPPPKPLCDQASLVPILDVAGDLQLRVCMASSQVFMAPSEMKGEEGLCTKLNRINGICSMMVPISLELGSACPCCTQDMEVFNKVEGRQKDDCVNEGVTLSLVPHTSLASDWCKPALSERSQSTDHVAAWNQLTCNIYYCLADPVALIDDDQNVLWYNNAYGASMEAAPDRRGVLPPHLYSLGLPTQLGNYKFSVNGSDSGTLATLWTFLKNPNLDLGASVFKTAQRSQCVDRTASNKVRTIAPLALRLIGSSMSLVSITDVYSESSPPHESLEFLKQQHEGILTSPVVISNSRNIVKWVNTAYKQMIGQPKCPWVMSLKGDSLDCKEVQSPLLTGETILRCCVEVPHLASTFAGWVNMEWRNYAGERNFMTLPCDVTRWVCTNDGGSVLFTWKLDVQASLRLTCGG